MKEEAWEAEEKVVGGRKVEGGAGGRFDLDMIGLVLMGVGISMFLNDRRRRRGVRGVKGRVEEL